MENTAKMENEFKASEDWLSSIPLMDDTQAGSLRRILNLAAQLPDDWSGMQGLTTLQEDFGALRFQLAFMSFCVRSDTCAPSTCSTRSL